MAAALLASLCHEPKYTYIYIYSMYVWRLLWLFVKLRDMKERLVGPL